MGAIRARLTPNRLSPPKVKLSPHPMANGYHL